VLTLAEKILFVIATAISFYLTYRGGRRIVSHIAAGHGQIDWRLLPQRLGALFVKVLLFGSVMRFRFATSLFHSLLGWSFLVLVIMDLIDPIYAWTGVHVVEHLGRFGSFYLTLTDFANAVVLISMAYLVIRRFVAKPASLSTRETTLLHPRARFGIWRDSFIVASFIILSNTARLCYSSFHLVGVEDPFAWQPIASAVASLWSGMEASWIVVGEHLSFWVHFGAILMFLPYFPYSKHIHLLFAPINIALKPQRASIGQLSYLNLDDPAIEQFGAATMRDLGWEQVMDAYACIMCFRCQEVCPAYTTGKVLSPAALEINKRYHLNFDGGMDVELTTLIPKEAIWACLACGACVDICPVGNEPMRDILEIRRYLALMESDFPKQLETAFRGMERNRNPWNVPQADRMKWAEGLNVPTIEQNPEPEILWWVGCAPATDARAQSVARAFAQILNAAGVNFAVLGKNEACTGDAARRAGREDVFFGLATQNVELLNEIQPKRIVTTCPHCLHTLKNEYPAFGGQYEVIHHTQLINELVGAGKIRLDVDADEWKVTFHDPCYLGRHNDVFEAPRQALHSIGVKLIEMPNHASRSFCCGAGGAQMWKEEEAGIRRVNEARYAEARATGATTIAVGCPFCMVMLIDASKADGEMIKVVDVAEMVVKHLKT